MGIGYTQYDKLKIFNIKYIETLAAKYGINDKCRSYFTPMETNVYGTLFTAANAKLLMTDSEINELKIHFPSIAAELCRFARVFRPDISFSSFLLARYTHCYTIVHIRLAVRVVKYLFTTKTLVWELNNEQYVEGQKMVISIAFDSDFAGCKETRKSTAGGVLFLNGCAIAHMSVQINVICTSVGHAETTALFKMLKAMIFLYNVLSQHWDVELPMKCKGDNNTALAYITNEECSERTKHWDVDLRYINEVYNDDKIIGERLDTENNMADIHTKPLPRAAFEKHRLALGIR